MSSKPLPSRLLTSIANGINLILKGHLKLVWQQVLSRIWSTSCSVGLRRDLHKLYIPPEANINITVRPMREGDAEIILNHEILEQRFPRLVRQRYDLVREGLPTAYVAVADGGTPCYMQWLIGPRDNNWMVDYFRGEFPSLNSDEALLEAAFMNPDFRGQGIMPAAMSRIAEKGEELGVRWVLTFVDIENIPSLKGCKRAGFSPYIMRKDQWTLFRRKITYEELEEKISAEFSLATA